MSLTRTVLAMALSTTLAWPASAQVAAAQAAPAPAGPPRVGESVVALVNDEIVTTYDLNQRMLLLILEARVQPTAAQLPQIQREALRLLVDERLQMQELRRVEKERELEGKLIATDAEVETSLGQLARQSSVTTEELLASIQQSGVSPATIRERLRIQLTWERWIGGRYGSRIKVGREQVQGTLKRISEAAARPQFRVSEIFIEAARVGGQAEALEGANQLYAQLQQGAPFDAVARQFSAAPSAALGGDTGWLTAEELPAAVRSTVEQMQAGQVSAPIPTPEGVYLVQLRQRTNGSASTVVNLKQAAIQIAAGAPAADVAAATAKLRTLRAQLNGCQDFETRAGAVQGVIAGDLGEADVADLAPEFQAAARTLQPGQISEPLRTQVGLHLVAVCGKQVGGARALTAEQVEDNLLSQQLAMVSRRYLRDLRNSATIETR